HLRAGGVVEAHVTGIGLTWVGRERIARTEEAIAIWHSVVAIVLARQRALPRPEAFHAVVADARVVQVGRQACDVARAFYRIPARTILHRHERERIRLGHFDVD